MRRQNDKPSQGFFWQGLFILLPVILLTGLGLVSLRQDRHLAEQDAKDRAHAMVQRLTTGLGRRVAGRLSQSELFANYRRGYSGWISAWPGNEMARLGESRLADFLRLSNEWASAYPDLQADMVLLPSATIAESGETLFPREWRAAPAPPDWFEALSDEQRQAWDAARALERSHAPVDEISAAWNKVLSSDPSPDLRANAEFGLLRLSIETNSLVDPVPALCRFGDHHPVSQTESGLPLWAVSFDMALSRSRETPLNEGLFENLRQQLSTSPSLLCAGFLAELERRAQDAPESVKRATHALGKDWHEQESLREVMRHLRQRLELRGILTTNLWFDTPRGSCFAVLNPTQLESHSVVDGKPATVTNQVTQVQVHHKSVVVEAFFQAVRETGLDGLDYFSLEVTLEKEPLFVLHPSKGTSILSSAKTASIPTMLESAGGELTLPARQLLNQPAAGQSQQLGAEFESMPSRPRFAVSLSLADPAAFYARHRQRTLWFGALILTAAGAAVIGFIRARRAFVREHQLSELKTNFVSSVSHELRAPIASVRLMAESLERGKVQDPVKQREYFGFIVQECRRLSSLVSNVLDFSRIEQGRKQYEVEPTDLPTLVRETVQLMRPYSDEHDVKLDLELPAAFAPAQTPGSSKPAEEHGDGPDSAAPIQVRVDGSAIQQALVNLIDNAIKHSPTGASVTVGLDLPDGDSSAQKDRSPRSTGTARQRTNPASFVRIWVADHGPGIPPSEQERIFERFYRLGSELRRETPGVGIGLSIVKHIVDAHNGRILVESRVGEGSRFTIELPVLPL